MPPVAPDTPSTVDTVIVASTERLARHLRVRHSMQRREAGDRVWPAPACSGYRSWVRAQWLATWPTEQLLHPAQELSLWNYAVESGDEAERALSKTAVARQARTVANLAADHLVPIHPLAEFASSDEAAFGRWSAVVDERLEKYGWTMEARLPGQLLAALKEGRWQPPPQLRLVGFLEETQAQRRLFDAIEAAGSKVTRQALPNPCEAAVRLCRPTTRLAQYRAVAGTARRLLAPYSGRTDVAPPRIGVLVPNVDEARAEFEPVLREYLAPFSSAPEAENPKPCWRYAQGQALAQHPLIGAALDWLSLHPQHNDFADLSRVLLSDGLFMAFGKNDRGQLDAALRDIGGSRYSLGRWARESERLSNGLDADSPAQQFALLLAALCRQLLQAPAEALPSQWADWYEQQLQSAQWATMDEPSADERQVLDAWQEALDVLRAMDTQVRTLSRARALAWLREIVADQPFQAAVSYMQPLHILGYRDALGMDFEHLLVLDFNAGVMPEPAELPAFLSAERLRERQVPSATPEACLQRGQQWLAHVQRQAPEVVFYSPLHDDRGAGLLPSPLLGPWPAVAEPDATDPSDFNACLRQGPQTEWPLHEDRPPPVADVTAEGIRGGTRILEDVAASPLIAFARARAGMRALPAPSDGLDPMVQGLLVHRVMERLWKQLSNQAQLRSLSADALQKLVTTEVEAAMEQDGGLRAADYGVALVEVERQRVIDLSLEWLQTEAARVLPFTVVAMELKAEAEISGLRQQLRLDRVDRVSTPEGERYLVIDYKTGSIASTSVWQPERLSQPQLPLYAVHAKLDRRVPRVDGVAFARVREGDCGFVLWSNFADALIADAQGHTKEGDAHWEQTLASWRQALDHLANQFMQGEVSIDPVGLGRSYGNDDLQPLIRQPLSPGDGE